MSKSSSSSSSGGTPSSMSLRSRAPPVPPPLPRRRLPSTRSLSPDAQTGVLNYVQVRSLLEHKYNVDGVGLFERIYLQRWWRFLEQMVPSWWSPNAMTLAGLLLNLLGTLLLVYYNPDARHSSQVPLYICARRNCIGIGQYP